MGACHANGIEKEKEENKINKDCFEMKKILGQGGFGKVFSVIHKLSGKSFAMKIMSK